MNPLLDQILSIILLVLGFGFVIFFHELGHFLAAKAVGIKVEQFAVGFGQALFSWRKGLGIRAGSSVKEYEAKLAEGATNIGDTEYRLNWIPLGGYVKMLGQDDLKANAQQDDPRAYNKKSIGARMIVVSAGVVMNIILAAIGFMIVFMMGFRAPPAIVGNILPGSPADKAGLRVGDQILYFDDKWQHDFTKISLNTALIEEGIAVPMYVRRPDGTGEHLTITPERPKGDPDGFLSLGIEQTHELRGVDPKDNVPDEYRTTQLFPPEALAINSGDVVTQINGKDVGVKDYDKLDEAMQTTFGKPVTLTIKKADGSITHLNLRPHFEDVFGKGSVNIAGMVPRASVEGITEKSKARAKLMPGDAIEMIAVNSASNPQKTAPTREELIKLISAAGESGKTIDVSVTRGGKSMLIAGLLPDLKVGEGRHGLGIQLGYDDLNPIPATVLPGSPAEIAGITPASHIVSVAGTPVQSWLDIHQILASAKSNVAIPIKVINDKGEEKIHDLTLSQEQIDALQPSHHWYTNDLVMHMLPVLHDRVEPRVAKNPMQAAAWGVTETRDFVLQFYITIKRMFQGSVSYKNMMGPVGIFHAGTKFAYKGNDWLIWFLAMISANLAVVNFLPIPIVDGGLFTFLILEKIMGKPLSPKAQAVAQYVGLALILGVFLLVTYQDITRFF